MHGPSQQSPLPQPPAGDEPVMHVKVIRPSDTPQEQVTPLAAVFVAHGIGQQQKYATLDQIAAHLIETDREERRHVDGSHTPDPEVFTMPCPDGYLHGVKLHLKGKHAVQEVHLFEGYWAPLTEGTVNLREVMAFLVSAGWNGLAKTGQQFMRLLFNQLQPFPADVRITIYLVTAMLVVAALMIMNTAIVTVAALSSPLTKSPAWLEGLRPDMTTVFNLFLIVAGTFGFILYRSYTMRPVGRSSQEGAGQAPPAPQRGWINVAIALFVATIGTTIACGVAIPLLFYGHVYGLQPHTEYLKKAFGTSVVLGARCGFSLLLVLLALAVLVAMVRWVMRMRWQNILARPSHLVCWGAVAMLAIVLALGLRLLVVMWPDLFSDGSARTPFGSPWTALETLCHLLSSLAWPVLIVVSWYVRKVLVQYVGDVVVYVASHKLDRFHSVRAKIRETIYTAAAAIYSAPAANGHGFAYDRVFLVGHSLGAVVVYDVLNQLINEDELGGRKWQVAGRTGRTKLLLTFGSPMDKIAFLFARSKDEGTGRGFVPIQEALVAAAQPLVQSAKFRQFEWINIYSPLDIISGKLDFYDPLPGIGTPTGVPNTATLAPKPVENVRDEEARTLLAAHVEYWDHPLLYQRLHAQITQSA